MKVLILNQDDKENRLIRQALDDKDVQVVNAVNKGGVYSVLKDDTDVVIFADFNHAKLDGLDLVNYILALQYSKFPFVVFMTNGEQENQVIESLGPVPGDVLPKPLEKNEIIVRFRMAERTLTMQNRMQANAERIDTGVPKYDELTNVLNRQAVYEQALAELSRAQREGFGLVVAMVEVLNLEKIYNQYGPEIRDQVVRFIARAARANLRSYDLVGRWIGGKFLLVLPGVGAETAHPAINRIHLAMTTVRVRVSDAKRIPLEVRIGYSLSGVDDHLPLYSLVDQANQALTKASITKELVVHAFSD